MAFDGITVAALVNELNTVLDMPDTRIYKIAQPENDELLLTLKTSNGQKRLLISASASLPLMYLTPQNKTSPMTAPNFCMLLRKHIQNGRIISVTQPSLERIIDFKIEHLNELGDLCTKHLIVEIMGKHSNIIFCDDNMVILDSIKHISAQISSVREVLPGREYFIPDTTHKKNPLTTDKTTFYECIFSQNVPAGKALYTSFTGISPLIAEDLVYRSRISSEICAKDIPVNEKEQLFIVFEDMISSIKNNKFSPVIIYNNKEPLEFSALMLESYSSYTIKENESISYVLETYYADKNIYTRIRQKSSDLRRIVTTALERNRKKLYIQEKQLNDTKKRDKYKVYGELIHTYGYGIPEGSSSFEALNYYTDEMITIPLDKDITPAQNAKKYFERYNKLKRTFESVTEQLEITKNEINHLESISISLDIALSEDDLMQIRQELADYNYIKKQKSSKKQKLTSKPFHYVSSDGYDIYVGKNNYQNEELTFQFANGGDWWFHAKNIPGSHVIVKSNGNELPDKVFEEAGKLAAYYSKARGNDKVEIDYTLKKNVKKPNGSAPGFVVYYTNYSLVIDSDISNIKQV